MHISVIGAGIIGLTASRALINFGHEVTLYERAPSFADGASGQNGAQLSYAYVAPLASPALLAKIPSLLFSKNAPLSIDMECSYAFVSWLWQFLKVCNHVDFKQATESSLKLAGLSRDLTHAWLRGAGHRHVGHRQNGKLVLLPDNAALAEARTQVALQARLGCPQQDVLSAADCVRVEPALVGCSTPFAGGVLTPSEEVADCKAVCSALLSDLQNDKNFEIVFNANISSFNRDGGRIRALTITSSGVTRVKEVDACLICAGVGSTPLLRSTGVRIPILPLKGYSIDVDLKDLQRIPQVSITDMASKVVFAPIHKEGSSVVRVAGFAELNRSNAEIPEHRIAHLARVVEKLFGAAQGVVTAKNPWCGHRPTTPTSTPYVGRVNGTQNLFINAGQGALGFTLAFGSAQLAAELISGHACSIPRSPFTNPSLAIV